jgi:methionyl aminopeptidase
MDEKEIESYKKAGSIVAQIREYVREIVKPGILLLDLARKIEKKIEDLGGKSAFPVSLAIDDVAAHYHPDIEDETKASGLLKVDFGVHVNGFIADNAMSFDLTDDKKHNELIDSSEEALKEALKSVQGDVSFNDVGKVIGETIEKRGFSPVVNLSGHGLGKYELHAGNNIPNYSNGNENKVEDGAYAVEPFATTGSGKIYEGPSGNVYSIIDPKNVRGKTARDILDYVMDKYRTLPFSLREIQEKFGAGLARLGLKELENNGVVKEYPQLIEKNHEPVAQAEHTFIKYKGKVIVTTLEK